MTAFDPAIDDERIVDDESIRLFPEDTGGLTLAARKALVVLLKRHHIWSMRHPREWAAIVKWRDEINQRLNDLFLELVVDEEREIAYKRQAGRDLGREFTTLLHDSTYTREEAGVLLHIREVYRREIGAGNDSAYVDKSAILTEIDYVRPPGTKDHAKADKYLAYAVERLAKDGFLIQEKSDPDRMRISPVIETLLTVERLHAFREALYTPDDDAAERSGEQDDDDANL